MKNRILEDKVKIEDDKVKLFFKDREKKELPHRYNYVNYQDTNPELAVIRDQIEKEKIGGYLPIKEDSLILDIGCGVGRWGDYIVPYLQNGKYIGVDYTQFFINLAKKNFKDDKRTEFINGSFQDIEKVLQENYEYKEFDIILSNGVMMYINDEDLDKCFKSLRNLLADGGIIYLKESVGLNKRLTLNDFPSNELMSEYSVIYRSIFEYTTLIVNYFLQNGFMMVACGPTWDTKVDYDNETSNWFWIIRSGLHI